ncbi:aldose epimerase family protein [Rubellicoccus peritrichatus]|uniref:Aldose 1-epimerase n=1 Tax=Rubellicoccus peritrichatus TaxID=3080537 RepID=A0AAQ3LDB3_9BACT|nr:aldose epimerase family protein [Puniceicoccus sp. CR14]WOO41770.1 aldose epimerase family protein [Puniceicoccus sp. CR14]
MSEHISRTLSQAPSITRRIFGQLPDGRAVEAWTLIGTGGLELEVMTYGGIVTRLLVPDQSGHLRDVVLGFDRFEQYLDEHPYFGAIVGRVAGRIPNAHFCIDGQDYELLQNDGTNHLHGGAVGLDKRLWTAQAVEPSDGSVSLELTYRSPDGEEGYPGNVDFTVTYTVTPENTVVFKTKAVTDQPTPVSLTNHSYFNLAGEGMGSIDDHQLQIFSDTTIEVDENLTPLGLRKTVSGSASDLNRPRRVADIIPELWMHHGDVYWVRRGEGQADALVPVARLSHPEGGIVMEVNTTLSCVQLYTGYYIQGKIKGKSGHLYEACSGLCLECEGYPDAVNKSGLGDIIVRPGQPQEHTTVYSFTTVS